MLMALHVIITAFRKEKLGFKKPTSIIKFGTINTCIAAWQVMNQGDACLYEEPHFREY